MQFRLFEESVYVNRRTELKKKVGSGLILLLGNEEAGMNYKDNWYPFRQDSTFLYYFGLNTAGLAALIDTDSGEEILFGDELTIDDIVWTGPLPSVVEMGAAVGVAQTAPAKALAEKLKAAQSKGQMIHFLPPYRGENRIKIAEWLSIPVGTVQTGASLPLIKAVISQRAYKQDCEIIEMHEATVISGKMHMAAMQYARAGMKEYEIVAKVKEVALAHDGAPSFSPIVTIHGETLHNVYAGNTLEEGQLLLCDAGASNTMQYAGDLTSTYPVGKRFSTKQREVYEIVLNAHLTAVSMLKPGVLFRDVYKMAARKIVEGLTDLGLMKGNAEEAVEAGAHAMFFQCGLGHMIGLDVHDMEDLGEVYVGYDETIQKSKQFGMKSLRLGRALEAGFTLTVEPGIYMIPHLMDLWRTEGKFLEYINYSALEGYRDFGGIRIEEDYLITAEGYRLLGNKMPLTVAELEAVRERVY